MARPPLTARRLFGIDRSGPPPPETRAGQPLHPWTVPNAIGFVRLALLPVFLLFAFNSDDGRIASASIVYAVIAGGDYVDGIAARITGQYSRLGALLDPIVDRLLVVSAVAVCWHYELLPRWALAILAAREVGMLIASQYGLRRGLDIEISWLGRIGVGPTMLAPFIAMVSVTWVADALLFLGLGLTLAATVVYLRDGRRALATTLK